jgi:arylsulfatase A-like enzyme
VRPVYKGLVKQIDDELGRLFDHLHALGRFDDTLIIFTADHGDLSGDHWLGEKEYFFEPVMRVPFIVVDPSPLAHATRGTTSSSLVESVDVVPTILDALGLPVPTHRIEGRSLLSLTRGASPADPPWRDCVFGQLDYAWREARHVLQRRPDECKGFMVRDERYKYMHWQGYSCQLFDLKEDPDELHDLGLHPAHASTRADMQARLFQWFRDARRRTTESDAQVEARTHAHERMMGILIGRW